MSSEFLRSRVEVARPSPHRGGRRQALVVFVQAAIAAPCEMPREEGQRLWVSSRDRIVSLLSIKSTTTPIVPPPADQGNHYWLKTDKYEAGMGAACAIPGQNCSDVPYTSTQTKDHTGQSDQEDATCVLQRNVDESCVDDLIAPGQPTGRWSIFNQCQSFAYSVIGRCRYGPQDGPDLPNSLNERGPLGSCYSPDNTCPK